MRYVAGADEAGRGSLAGPLVAAAVLIDYATLSLSDRRALGGLHDSKQLSPEDREDLYPRVLRAASRVSVTVRCVRGIDGRGLHNTNLEALATSLERVACDGAACLVDGFRLPRCAVEHRPVVDGDATSAAIAAASVVAKVSRDRYMRRAETAYPGWGFEENVGYSTPEHREAILENGISALHRRSFQSIAYSQLALDGDLGAELERIADVLEVADASVPVDGHPDHVETDLAVGGERRLGGEPGSSEAADAALLDDADREDGTARAA
jgi:ribonuclease HII